MQFDPPVVASGVRHAELEDHRAGGGQLKEYYAQLFFVHKEIGLEPCVRPVNLKQVFGGKPLPYGDDCIGFGVYGEGGLDGLSGSEGRIFPGSNVSSFSLVPAVHLRR